MLRPGKGYDNGLPSHGGGGGGTGYGGYNSGGYNGGGGGSSSAYGGYSGAQAYNVGYPLASSVKPQHSKRNKEESPVLKYVLIIFCLLLFGTTLHYRGKYNGTLSKLNVKSIDEAVRIVTDVERDKERWKRDSQQRRIEQDEFKKKIDKLVAENRKLQKEKDELRIKYETQPPPQKGDNDPKKMASRAKAMMKQIELLQNATQRESKRVVLDRFGPGPHHVKLSLQLPGDAEGMEHYVVVEMAPLDLMPHAVHLFLEQVAHQLWDNTVLYLNGPHIMQAGPQDYIGDSEIWALQRFEDKQLDKLAFPEYSPEYPHLPFTLGYTGRPGGPDFYINKGDNTLLHGPGGQSQHGLQEQADPCFATVVEGQDVIRQIHDLPTYKPDEEFAYFFQQPVVIASARIIDAFAERKKLEDSILRYPVRPRNVEIEHEIERQVDIVVEE